MSGDKLPVYTVSDIYQSSDLQYLVEKLIHKGTVVLVSGAAKIGKSILMLQLCRSLCDGKKFLGEYQCEEARVLIIDEENGKATLKGRLQGMGFDENEQNLYMMCSKGFKIDDPDWFQMLKDYIRDEKITVVIFDPFIRIHSKEENTASEMREVSRMLRVLADEGVTVIVIHHSGKSYEGGGNNHFRGSSEITAGVDSAFYLKENKDGIIFGSSIQRDLPGDININLKKEVTAAGNLRFLLADTAPVPKKEKKELAKDAILEVMSRKAASVTMKDLLPLVKAMVAVGEKNIRDAVNELKAEGKVVSRSGEHNEAQFELAKTP